MTGIPARTEAAPYYFKYIDRITSDDIVGQLEIQLPAILAFLQGISEEKSLHRYASDKWTIRQVLGHVSDCERMFSFRAFWFARGFSSPLPSYDQDTCVAAAGSNEISWAEHLEEFQRVRSATLSFFQNLPARAWARTGIASDNSFTVKALAYIAAGHVDHHVAILRERYF